MHIKVDDLRKDKNRLSKLIEDYNSEILNMYNELSYSSNYWQSNVSIRFYDSVDVEKKANETLIMEISEIQNVYEHLIKNYETFGNEILCVINDKSAVINSINKYLNKLSRVIKMYQNLDLSFCPNEAKILNRQVKILNNNYSKILKTKNKIEKYFNNIILIEKEVKNMISKIKIKYLTESDIQNLL